MKNQPLASTSDVAAAREHLGNDFQSLVSHAEELLQATTTLSGETVDLARQKLSQSLSQVKSQAIPLRDAAIERSKAAADAAIVYAREKPWQTAAIVVLAAFAIGFISKIGRSEK
jgi:ElaB/YqjD/DUF883 family membrane-anchored ribosome-binding protein